MDVIGDYLYMGIDMPFHVSLKRSWVGVMMLRPCHRSQLDTDAANRYPLHNAGAMGCTKHVMLAYFVVVVNLTLLLLVSVLNVFVVLWFYVFISIGLLELV